MTGFSSPDLLVRTRDGRHVVLVEYLEFTRPPEVGGQKIVMPPGATSDGASIPEALWSTGLAPFGTWWRACVLHDGCYRGTTIPRIDDRATADLILWEALVASGVDEAVARTIYAGVRAGGQAAWDQDRTQRV
jgi:hypothetical protein